MQSDYLLSTCHGESLGNSTSLPLVYEDKATRCPMCGERVKIKVHAYVVYESSA